MATLPDVRCALTNVDHTPPERPVVPAPLQSLIAHSRIDDLRPSSSHGFDWAEERAIMDAIYARGDRLMVWFLVSHMALALLLALYHGTWLATLALGGGACATFMLARLLWPRTFFTRAYACVAQQAFVALHIYQLYGQSEQHFWYFTAFTMMIVYQDWVCMWPGALLIIAQHSIFAALQNSGMPVHFFPEAYVGFTKLFFHFGIALVQVSLCGYWAHLLRAQSLGDAWQKLQLGRDQSLLLVQLGQLQGSELQLRASSDALVASSRQQQAILDNCPDSMWVRDLDSRMVAVNSGFARQLGRAADEISGRTVEDLFGEAIGSVFRAQDQQVLVGRRAMTFDREFVLHAQTRNFETTVTPIFDADGDVTGTAGIARDVTERKGQEEERQMAESRMQQAQKLESLGMLAGGIAHDFNNLLVGILANAELAKEERPLAPPVMLALSQIETSAHRAADLTKQMLAYAGKGKVAVQPLDMSQLVHDMADLLRTVVSKRVTFRMELDDDLPPVEGDATQLRQVIMNLITNASDALGETDGVIALRTEVQTLDDSAVTSQFSQTLLRAGRYVVVEVRDTGVGMDSETLERMFDPFFTTKFVGRGLGLAAVLGIMRAHDGTIDVVSAPHQGTTFRVFLPSGENASVGRARGVSVASTVPVALASPREPGSDRLVLIVDDEDNVRSVAQRVVERAGFVVVTASDGIEAIALARTRAGEVALVLLDMLMPKMNGEQTFLALRREYPTLPVLLTSGFSEEESAQRLLNEPAVAFIQKPYGVHHLLEAIDHLLRASPRTVL